MQPACPGGLDGNSPGGSKYSRASRRIFRGKAKMKDPVKKFRKDLRRERQKQRAMEAALEAAALRKAEEDMRRCSEPQPSLHTRWDVKARGVTPIEERPRTFVAPLPRKWYKEAEERHRRYIEMLNFCEDKGTEGGPTKVEDKKLSKEFELPSPEVSHAKVMPKRPSYSPSAGMPEPPTDSALKLRQPKSKIIINEKQPQAEVMSSFELMLEGKSRAQYEAELKKRRPDECMPPPPPQPRILRKKRKKSGKKKKRRKREKGAPGIGEEAGGEAAAAKVAKEDIDVLMKKEEQLYRAFGGEGEEEGAGEIPLQPLEETYLTRMFRKQVSMVSESTSYNEKEFLGFEATPDMDLEECPYLDKLLQKFRRDSELERYKKPRRKIKKGTLESHSFTNLKQKTAKQFFYGVISGAMHQGDEHFSEKSRNQQGICMPVAAYCYATVLHPNKWTDHTINEILLIGDKLFQDSVEQLHLHDTSKELKAPDLFKYVYIDDEKLRFTVEDPYISGSILSVEKNVYNISKALKLFFVNNRAGILQTLSMDVLVWKDKYFYMFDARPRKKDLYPDLEGQATLTIVYDLVSLATIFLERSGLGNWPFIISKVSVMKKLKLFEEEEEDVVREDSTYNILSPSKAVVQGSFDLADKCFCFSRNKQALAMAVTALVYSRITPPNAWHKRTVDKIMIIGNQLYLECAEQELILEMTLDNLPALFTVGPYLVQIFIYANREVDLMYKRGKCNLLEGLDRFFSKNTNGILQIGKYTIAVWQQRYMYYCFDPYPRNNQGLFCRNGVGCVSMNVDVKTLVDTICQNFDDRTAVYNLHALKVLKIHRDPAMQKIFPKHTKMDDISPETFKKYKMKKSRKSATEKPVTIDLTGTSIKRLLPGESPEPSLQEIDSDIDSLTRDQLPTLPQPCHILKIPPIKPEEYEHVVDLDSPSLSDTQIEPPKPVLDKDIEEITLMDLDSFQLTQEELEMVEVPEGEGEEGMGKGEGEGEGEGGKDLDELDNTYLAMNEFSQVHSESLDSYHSRIEEQVNTEVTAAFLPVSRKVLPPTNILERKQMRRCIEMRKLGPEQDICDLIADEPDVTQSQELEKECNFILLPDDTELVRGTQNVADIGGDTDNMAPFTCIIASAVAKKYDIVSWSGEIIDYVLSGGAALYELANVRFDQAPKLEIPKLSLGRDNYSVQVDFLYSGQADRDTLEKALDEMLFLKYNIGILVTSYYSCAVFYKNHLYYLFEPYGCNEVGLGEGPNNKGMACFSRFKNVLDLIKRIMYNKNKREIAEEFRFSKFILSSVTVSTIRTTIPCPIRKYRDLGEGEDEIYEPGEDDEIEVTGFREKEELPPPKNVVGYHFNNGFYTIRGSKALRGRSDVPDQLKEDHFVCICASIMLSCCPLESWDTRRINYVIDHGLAIFAHADSLDVVDKRIIKNVLVDKYFFDIIVRRKEIPIEYSKGFNMGMEICRTIFRNSHYIDDSLCDILNLKCSKEILRLVITNHVPPTGRSIRNHVRITAAVAFIMRKSNQLMIQFPNCCYVLYKYQDFWHMFDPYPCLPNGKKDDSGDGYASWTKFRDMHQVRRRIKQNIVKGAESYSFYRYEITSIRKAPKKMILEQKLMLYEMRKEKQGKEEMTKPLYEEEAWLEVDPIPWSRRKKKNACNQLRCRRDTMWNEWDIEYPNDLYSLLSSINQYSARFDENVRGKQTLCNLVVAIAMTYIYDLSEWNVPIMDCILINGDVYFRDCTKNISEEDYEMSMDDLISDCSIFPYKFKVDCYPMIDGTMFLVHVNKFNLYKALKYFLDGCENRTGIICASRGEIRRFVAFGKIHDREYFMYDCQAYGPPMFTERNSSAYLLRCTTFARLLHILTVTLRGGDFYIYHVACKDFEAISE